MGEEWGSSHKTPGHSPPGPSRPTALLRHMESFEERIPLALFQEPLPRPRLDCNGALDLSCSPGRAWNRLHNPQTSVPIRAPASWPGCRSEGERDCNAGVEHLEFPFLFTEGCGGGFRPRREI